MIIQFYRQIQQITIYAPWWWRGTPAAVQY